MESVVYFDWFEGLRTSPFPIYNLSCKDQINLLVLYTHYNLKK
tara:strand:+ start:76 stop:204 length:129 start_codon:yes stop_codon:yes gene_type:complete